MGIKLDVNNMNFSKSQKLKSKSKLFNMISLEPYMYLLPAFILFAVFTFYPFFKTIFISLTMTNSFGLPVKFIGLKNYVELIKSSEFISSIFITIEFVILTTIPTIIFSLLLALLVERKNKLNGFFETLFSMPIAISSAAGSLIWLIMLNPSSGIINYALRVNINWLSNKAFVVPIISIITIWLNLGINFIFFLTALRNMPKEVLESAAIDGVNWFQRIYNVVLPLISPTMFFVIFINLVTSFQSFTQFSVLAPAAGGASGGPTEALNVFVYKIYDDAFINNRFDIACTESVILFVIMLIVVLIQFRFEKKGVNY